MTRRVVAALDLALGRALAVELATQELPYPLLSDDGGALLSGWGLINPGTMYGKPVTKVDRNTYFIDGEGVVRKVWEKVSPPGHPQEVLEYVKSLKA